MDDCPLCEVCQVPAKQSCSSCHSSFYCSKECQRKAWKKHKSVCIPYSIEIHPVLGRYVVASRDIKPGETVMREAPAALGPKYLSRTICLGCHKAITGTHTCSKCNFPLCSASCENSVFHEAECQVLSKAKGLIHIEDVTVYNPAYECILPLRCLLTKYMDPKKWKTITNLQDHTQMASEEWNLRVQTNIIDFFKNYMNFKGVDTEEIYRICGILQTNSFEVKHNGQAVEAVLPKVAMMAHDCSPNTENIFDQTIKVTVRSTVFIPKGASITTTYANLMWNTQSRRKHLLKAKFFSCCCQRCADPTELGAHSSTLICSQCSGLVTSTQPLNSDAVWCCKSCNYTMQSEEVEMKISPLRKSFLSRDKSQIMPLDDLIKHCSGKLHPQHQVTTEAKLAWIIFCGNHPQYRYKDLPIDRLETKISYCRELMKVADAIFPGRSQIRGFALYELHAALRILAKKISSVKENKESAKEYMKEAEANLQEVREIFCGEGEMKDRGIEEKIVLLEKDLEAMC